MLKIKKHLLNITMCILTATVICSNLQCSIVYITNCYINNMPYVHTCMALYAIIGSILLSILGSHKILDLFER